MRLTIDIDEALLRDAMAASGVRTKREAVEMGLRTLLRLSQQEGIRAWRGKLAWEGDLYAMRTDGVSRMDGG